MENCIIAVHCCAGKANSALSALQYDINGNAARHFAVYTALTLKSLFGWQLMHGDIGETMVVYPLVSTTNRPKPTRRVLTIERRGFVQPWLISCLSYWVFLSWLNYWSVIWWRDSKVASSPTFILTPSPPSTQHVNTKCLLWNTEKWII